MVAYPVNGKELLQLLDKQGLQSTAFEFHGFAGRKFQSGDDVSAQIVVPKEPAAGNPWIWRARFWGHQPALDIGLLRQGYHVAYYDVANLYGSPEAVDRWNTFYDLAQRLELSAKPILEGMSRGGLIAFNWAKANPEKVSAIYGDNPVCDIRSWPAKKSPVDWQRCLAAYGLSESEVSGFTGNPIDGLSPLADASVPVFLVLGEEDKVVPIAENGVELARRYRKVGGKVQVWNKPGQGHHPHGLHPVTPLLNSLLASTQRPVIKQMPVELLRNSESILVLGDSITYSGQYVSYFATWAKVRHGIDPDRFANLGLPSETVSGLSEAGHAGGKFPRPDLHERLERVLDQIQPDLVFANYGINCGIYESFDQGRFKAYQSGLETLNAVVTSRGAEIVMLTPPVFDGQVSESKEFYEGVLHSYSHWLIGQQEQSWRIIDTHFAMQRALENKRQAEPQFTFQPDAVHPSEEGHRVIAAEMVRAFEPKFTHDQFKHEDFQQEYTDIHRHLKASQAEQLEITKHRRPSIPGYQAKTVEGR